MSRVGKQIIKVPDKVRVRIENGVIFVEGPKGKLEYSIPPLVDVLCEDKTIKVTRRSEDRKVIALHGTTKAIISNMVAGVLEGFSKILDIVGIGYKAEPKGRELMLSLGFSSPFVFPLPCGIEAKVDRQTRITISGCDKKLVGEVAAKLRRIRPPEPYKGKGIRYADELVKQKVGKAAVVTTT